MRKNSGFVWIPFWMGMADPLEMQGYLLMQIFKLSGMAQFRRVVHHKSFSSDMTCFGFFSS